MRVLLTGANGFIGSQLTSRLLAANFKVVAAVRDPEKFRRRFPNATALKADLNTWIATENWYGALNGIDAVVNCAGALHGRKGQHLEAIHAAGPIALFSAAAELGVKKIIQMSAVSTSADTEFSRTKEAADRALELSKADWTIMKPSIVYGKAAYGGTAMLRGLAACPFVIPVIGSGKQTATPIHVDDLADVVLMALQTQKLSHQIVLPCGPETLTLAEICAQYRRWFGLRDVSFLHVPMWILRLIAPIGDKIGNGPLTATSLKQLEHGNAADSILFQQQTGLSPRRLSQALQDEPSSTAELWHARFYLIKPAIRAALVFLWVMSGLAGLLAPPQLIATQFASLALPTQVATLVGYLASVADLAIAAALLLGRWPKSMFVVQMLLVIFYSIFLTVTSPILWLDLFGSLVKNIPILALIICHRILDEER